MGRRWRRYDILFIWKYLLFFDIHLAQKTFYANFTFGSHYPWCECEFMKWTKSL